MILADSAFVRRKRIHNPLGRTLHWMRRRMENQDSCFPLGCTIFALAIVVAGKRIWSQFNVIGIHLDNI